MLLKINEKGKWNPDPAALSPSARAAQDEDLFQTARRVNCGHFMNIIISDYIGAILGLTKDGSDWALDPLSVSC